MTKSKKPQAQTPTAEKVKLTGSLTNAPTVPTTRVPEVAALEEVRQRLDALKAKHPSVFRELSSLADEYNAAVENADKAVHVKGVSCGPFINYTSRFKDDPELMYEEVGHDLFLQCGGTITKTTKYEIDKAKLEKAIASGLLPEECLQAFRTICRNYRKPSALVLP